MHQIVQNSSLWIAGWSGSVLRASWQGGLLIVLVWLICKTLPRLPAAIRGGLWWLACAKLLVGLIWTTPLPLPILPPAAATPPSAPLQSFRSGADPSLSAFPGAHEPQSQATASQVSADALQGAAYRGEGAASSAIKGAASSAIKGAASSAPTGAVVRREPSASGYRTYPSSLAFHDASVVARRGRFAPTVLRTEHALPGVSEPQSQASTSRASAVARRGASAERPQGQGAVFGNALERASHLTAAKLGAEREILSASALTMQTPKAAFLAGNAVRSSGLALSERHFNSVIQPSKSNILVPLNLPRLCFWLWLSGVVGGAGITFIQALALRRLVRRAGPVDAVWATRVAGPAAAKLGLRQLPSIRISRKVAGPLAVGPLRPVVLLPPLETMALSEQELRGVLAHEFAHIRRSDLLLSLVPALTRLLFFFHPLVWLACREYETCCEAACDAATVRATGMSAAFYGRLLLKLVSVDGGSHPTAALGLNTGYQQLKRRLLMLHQLSSRSRRSGLGLLLLVGVAAAGVLPWRMVAAQSTGAKSPAPPRAAAAALPKAPKPPASPSVPRDVASAPEAVITREGEPASPPEPSFPSEPSSPSADACLAEPTPRLEPTPRPKPTLRLELEPEPAAAAAPAAPVPPVSPPVLSTAPGISRIKPVLPGTLSFLRSHAGSVGNPMIQAAGFSWQAYCGADRFEADQEARQKQQADREAQEAERQEQEADREAQNADRQEQQADREEHNADRLEPGANLGAHYAEQFRQLAARKVQEALHIANVNMEMQKAIPKNVLFDTRVKVGAATALALAQPKFKLAQPKVKQGVRSDRRSGQPAVTRRAVDDFTLPVEQANALRLRIPLGDITAFGEGNQIRIHQEREVGADDEATANDLLGRLKLGSHREGVAWIVEPISKNFSSHKSVRIRVRLTVQLPRALHLTATTGFGRIEASGLGRADLHTGSGKIEAREINGPLQTETGFGEIRIDRVGGSVEARTGSGAVTIERSPATVKVDTGFGPIVVNEVGAAILHSGSGKIEAHNVRGDTLARTGFDTIAIENVHGNVRADSGSGVITLRHVQGVMTARTGFGRIKVEAPDFQRAPQIDLETGSGDIFLFLRPDVSAQIEARSGAGDIKLSGAPLADRSRTKGGYKKIQLLDGKGRIHLQSGMGAVHIDQSSMGAAPNN